MQKPVQALDVPVTPAKADAEGDIDLLQVAAILWRGKIWIALCAGLALGIGYHRSVLNGVALYTASAEMALEVDQAPMLDLDAVVSGVSSDEASINTQMAVIRSGDLIGRLVDELRLDEDPEFNPFLPDPEARPGLLDGVRAMVGASLRGLLPQEEPAPATEVEIRRETIEMARAAIETTSGWDTYVFGIAATTRDPDKSALLANTLARLYRDDQLRLKVEATERAATWLSVRVGELRAELDARQNDIADLRARSSLVSAESLEALNAQAIELRASLQEAQGQGERAEERLARLRAAEAGSDAAKVGAAQDGQLDAIAEAVEAGEPGARSRFDRRFGHLILQVEAERERAREREAELRRTVDDLSQQFESQSADFQALQQLEQEAEATRVLYETFLTRLKETTVQASIHQSDSRILTEASPGAKVAPRTKAALAAALALGLGAGVALVLGREFLQSTFRSADALEQHTGRAVLGQIPRIPVRGRVETVRYLRDKPTSAPAEAVRNLRTSLLLSNVDDPPRVVMVTSSVPGEGKTTLAIALAQNLAGLGKRVLLIEGDIRRRTFDAYFQAEEGHGGLVSVIAGQDRLADAVFRSSAMAGVDILAGERRPSVNAADLFSSDSFRRLVQEARDGYDHVLIDTPPVLVVPDARVIAQQADAVMYAVRWDSTARGQVEEGLRQFRSVNVAVTGLVLSQVDPKGMRRYGHGGRYGAYSRYARGYYDA